jgi:hypothetical protein
MPLRNLITDNDANNSSSGRYVFLTNSLLPGQNSTSYIAEFIEARR